eukprot:2615220-Alexandrium_andersonii.AAC.1
MACSKACSARRDQSTHRSWRKRMPAEVRSVARPSAMPWVRRAERGRQNFATASDQAACSTPGSALLARTG